jgi:hypothetical protein
MRACSPAFPYWTASCGSGSFKNRIIISDPVQEQNQCIRRFSRKTRDNVEIRNGSCVNCCPCKLRIETVLVTYGIIGKVPVSDKKMERIFAPVNSLFLLSHPQQELYRICYLQCYGLATVWCFPDPAFYFEAKWILDSSKTFKACLSFFLIDAKWLKHWL